MQGGVSGQGLQCQLLGCPELHEGVLRAPGERAAVVLLVSSGASTGLKLFG